MANHLRHPDDGLVYACPECDAAQIERYITADYLRCRECGAVFDEPTERTTKASTGRDGMRAELIGMNPEDVGLSPIGKREA